MASPSSEEADRYALVSSFYGPGAVIGWYLTTLACLVSNGLHPRKRRVDSITADLVAMLAFPTVAAIDLVKQMKNYPTVHEDTYATPAQKAACVEATLIVIETSLAICVVLFLLAVGFKCVKRGCLLAAVGDFVFFAECYLYFSKPMKRAVEQSLDRSFMINFGSMLISVMVVLVISIVLAFGLIVFFFAMRPPRAATTERPNTGYASHPISEAERLQKGLDRDFLTSRHSFWLSLMTMAVLPFTIVASMFPFAVGLFMDRLPSKVLPWVGSVFSRIARDLIPRSNTLVTELDQAVAVLAGATVLGFSFYSLAEDYYQRWLLRNQARPQQPATELTQWPIRF